MRTLSRLESRWTRVPERSFKPTGPKRLIRRPNWPSNNKHTNTHSTTQHNTPQHNTPRSTATHCNIPPHATTRNNQRPSTTTNTQPHNHTTTQPHNHTTTQPHNHTTTPKNPTIPWRNAKMMIMMTIFDPTRGSCSLGRVPLRRNTL